MALAASATAVKSGGFLGRSAEPLHRFRGPWPAFRDYTRLLKIRAEGQ